MFDIWVVPLLDDLVGRLVRVEEAGGSYEAPIEADLL